MLDTMHAADGAGLAAPQIGVDLQLVIFGSNAVNPRYPDAAPIPRTVLLNPVITPLPVAGARRWSKRIGKVACRCRACAPWCHAMRRACGTAVFDQYGDRLEREVDGCFMPAWCSTNATTCRAFLYPMRVRDFSRFRLHVSVLFPGLDAAPTTDVPRAAIIPPPAQQPVCRVALGAAPASVQQHSVSTAIWSRLYCSCAPSIRKVSSTRSPSVAILASCRLMSCRANTRATAYNRPTRSLAVMLSNQRWPFSSGRSVTRGVIGKLLHPARDPALAGLAQWRRVGNGLRQSVFDHAGQFTVVLGHGRCDHLEGIERITIARRVDARIENAETTVVEVAADAGEQVRLVARIDQDLQPFAHGRASGAHDRLVDTDVARQLACVPGDVGRVVAHEIPHVECVPQLLVCIVRQRMQARSAPVPRVCGPRPRPAGRVLRHPGHAQ